MTHHDDVPADRLTRRCPPGATPHRRATRRLLSLLALGALALVLTACGAGDTAPLGRTTASRSPADVAAPTTAGTRTVVDASGREVEVPAHPQRIVVLNQYSPLDALVAVGVKPAGSSGDPAADYPYADWLRGQTDGIKMVGSTEEPDLEQIALLEPDLILSNPWQEDIHPELDEIAAHVTLPLSYSDYEEELRYLADLLGEEAAAEQLIAEHHQRLEQFRAAMGDRRGDIEVSVVRIFPDGIRAGGGGYLQTLLDAAGLRRPPGQQTDEQTELSLEQVEQVDADVIFVYSAANAELEGDNARAREQVLNSRLWGQLDATRHGRVHVVDSFLWAGGGIQWADAVLDDLFRYLVADQ